MVQTIKKDGKRIGWKWYCDYCGFEIENDPKWKGWHSGHVNNFEDLCLHEHCLFSIDTPRLKVVLKEALDKLVVKPVFPDKTVEEK